MTKMLNQPLDPTTSCFKKEGLHLELSKDTDLQEYCHLKLGLIELLAPTLLQWYKQHPESLQTEFFDPQSHFRLAYSVRQRNALVGIGIVHGGKEKAELTSIYLNPKLHGKGLGYALLHDLLLQAKQEEYDSIELTTRREFTDAVRLYEKVGFKNIPNTKYPESKNTLMYALDLRNYEEYKHGRTESSK